MPGQLVLDQFTVLSWRTLLLVEWKVYTDNSARFSLSHPQQVSFYFLFLGLTILEISCKGMCTLSVFWEWLAWLCLMSSRPHCVVAYSEGWYIPPSPVAYMTAGFVDSGPHALSHLLSPRNCKGPGHWSLKFQPRLNTIKNPADSKAVPLGSSCEACPPSSIICHL